MTAYCISSPDGLNLRFEDEESYRQFKEDEELLFVKHYNLTRAKHGIWASNHGKYVASPEELNDWDSRYMESLREKVQEMSA